jgi:hypothetical protein
MWTAFLSGGRTAARCGPLTITLWLINALYGAAFGVASGYWLAESLSGSLATRTLLKDLDANVLIDLFYHHGSSLQMLLVVAAFLATAYVVVWIPLYGAIIATVRERGVSLRGAFRHAFEWSGRLALLFVIALASFALLTTMIGAAAWWTLRFKAASPSEMTPYIIVGAAAAMWWLGAVLLGAIHDHARIRACAVQTQPFTAYWWAVRFVLRGRKNAFLVAFLLHLVGLAIWAVYQSVAANLPVAEGLGVAGSLLWGQAYLVARMVLRVWFFASESRLQELA